MICTPDGSAKLNGYGAFHTLVKERRIHRYEITQALGLQKISVKRIAIHLFLAHEAVIEGNAFPGCREMRYPGVTVGKIVHIDRHQGLIEAYCFTVEMRAVYHVMIFERCRPCTGQITEPV